MAFRSRYFRGAPRPRREHRINEDILIREVRVIDQNGAQVGVIPTEQARRLALERGYDLVEIAPMAKPPVCKLLNYGKFLYELKKKKRESAKKVHVQQLKEVQLRPRTEKHDLDTKVNHAREFLQRGDKVMFTVTFRGRENAHRELGREMLGKIKTALEEIAKIEMDIRQEGNRMHLMLLPKPGLKAKRPPAAAAPAEVKGEAHAEAENRQSGPEAV